MAGRRAFPVIRRTVPGICAKQKDRTNVVDITPQLSIPDTEFEWSFARSGGPGGQNVNKVASKAILRWDVTSSPSLPPDLRERFLAQNRGRITTEGVFVVSSERTRSQLLNRQDCLDLLAARVLQATRVPRRRKKTRPTRGSKERRLQEKKRRSSTKAERRGPVAE
jgi:ribosome-associated protein